MSLELPFRCTEATSLLAAYLVKTRHLARVTPERLRVVEVFPGWAAVGIACIEYRQTSAGAYGEVGISWPTVPATQDPLLRNIPALPLLFGDEWPGLGWWVHKLPVTTEAARDAGVSLWGYPKFLARIDFSWDGSTRRCRLAEGEDEILDLSVDTRMAARPQTFSQRTYTEKDGQLLGTVISFDGTGGGRYLALSTQLHLGHHPIGEELSSWGLGRAPAVNVQWFPVWRAVLPGPGPG